MSEKAMSLTAEDLKSILSSIAENNREDLKAVLAEVRKPKDPTPGELAASIQDEFMRRNRADLERDKQEMRRMERDQCPHKHQWGQAAVGQVSMFSPEPNTDFLICTKCQAKIKPAKGPYDEIEGDYIYDRRLYFDLLGSLPKTTY